MTYQLPVSAAGSFVGSVVSNIVYSAICASGDIVADVTKSGIEITGNVIGLGTEAVAGPLAGNTVRALAKTYGAVAKPTISTGSELSALGISFVAGTGAALTTTAILYGGNKIGSYLQGYYITYKKGVAKRVQQPDENLTSDRAVLCIDDINHLQLIE